MRHLMSSDQQIRFGFVSLVVLSLVLAVASALALGRVRANEERLVRQHARELLDVGELRWRLVSKLADLRGFLLSGDASHLKQLAEDRAALLGGMARLRGRLELPESRALLEELEAAEARHHEAAAGLVQARKKGASAARVGAKWEKRITPIRIEMFRAIEGLESLERRQLERGVDAAESQNRRVVQGLVSGVILSVLFAGLLLRMIGRALRERASSQRELIQARNELEARVRERTAELQAANQELEAFSYSVSHDLRAPLRGIDGFSQALLEDYGSSLDATARDYLARVRAGVQRMGVLIDDLLNLSRLTRTELRRELVDLSRMAREVMVELHATDPSRKVRVEIEDGLVAEGDPGLLHAVLANLLGNAWKFSGKTADAEVRFGSRLENGERVYFVSDNGAGFDMRYYDKLFGAFQRLHGTAEYEGTGIGLATVRRVVARHGGRVWARSAPGQGAQFFFTLGHPPSRRPAEVPAA